MEASKAESQTTYVVLEERRTGGPDETAERVTNVFYVELDRIEARSGKAAVSDWMKRNGIEVPGVFMAVPVRSWQPIKPSVETQTRIKFS